MSESNVQGIVSGTRSLPLLHSREETGLPLLWEMLELPGLTRSLFPNMRLLCLGIDLLSICGRQLDRFSQLNLTDRKITGATKSSLRVLEVTVLPWIVGAT